MRTALRLFALTIFCACSDDGQLPKKDGSRCFDASPELSEYEIRRVPLSSEIVTTFGVSLSDRRIDVFDLAIGSLSSFDDRSGALQQQLGRSGGGPAEFASIASAQARRAFPTQWIESVGDSLYAFDGQRISLWLNARYVHAADAPAGVHASLAKVSALRSAGGFLLLGVETPPPARSSAETNGRLSLHPVLVSQGQWSETPLVFATLPWPRDESGRLARGLAEASPSWDAMGKCVVFYDGHSDTIVVADVDSRRVDSIVVRLPLRFAHTVDAIQYKKLGVQAGEQTMLYASRVRALSIDRYGVIWLKPSRPIFDGEVWKVNSRTGTFVIDTAPAFPLRFHADGRGVGVAPDSLGLLQLFLFTQPGSAYRR